ncbi:MAG: hypothetical protein ABIS50_03585 [Luteolibacter sp.]|uniref:hypothetical protein n=1 Tax=Luteolibacter sp. TaxID=1962973 RepID=UPI0032644354
MKTIIDCPATSSNNPYETASSSRLANFGRLLLAALCVSLVSFAASPTAFAAAPNGSYEFTSASGSAEFGDHTVHLPQALVKKLAGVIGGKITIEDSTLQLNRNATAKVVTEIGDKFDFSVETSVTGPTSLVLEKGEIGYAGQTADPIVVAFDGNFHGEDFSGELSTQVSARVKGKTLTVVVKFSGHALGADFSGKLTVVGKR